MNKKELIQRAESIRDQRGFGMNSASKVGKMLIDMINAAAMIPFDGVIDSVRVEPASHDGFVDGKVLYVKNPSSGMSVDGTIAFAGKQFVIAVEQDGKTKYITNWSERIKYQEDSKPYTDEIYTCGDTMYHWNGTDLVPYVNELQYIEFAGILDSVTVEMVGLPVEGTKENVYYSRDVRSKGGALSGVPDFVMKMGTGFNTKFYNVFSNKSLWCDQENIPYRNKFYRESGGALHTFDSGISEYLRPTFSVSREEFDDLISRVDNITGGDVSRDEFNVVKNATAKNSASVSLLRSTIVNITNEGFNLTDNDGRIFMKCDADGLDVTLISEHLKSLIKGIDGLGLELGETTGRAYPGDKGTELQKTQDVFAKSLSNIRNLTADFLVVAEDGVYFTDPNGHIHSRYSPEGYSNVDSKEIEYFPVSETEYEITI